MQLDFSKYGRMSLKGYIVILGSGDIWISSATDWQSALQEYMIDDFSSRIREIEDEKASGRWPSDYDGEGSWDDISAIEYYIDLLKSSGDNPELIAEAWNFSDAWNWLKVIDSDSGEIIFETYGNQGNFPSIN